MAASDWLAKSDDELMAQIPTGDDSSPHIAYSLLMLRAAQRQAEAAEKALGEMTNTLRATKSIACYTLWVAIFTGAVAVITLITGIHR